MKRAVKRILSNKQPQVMGILNVTPDSFSDGGKFNRLDAALLQAEQMLLEGADIIDIGGESTRPGAMEVSLQQELDRVIPVIERVQTLGKPISVDTSKAQLMLEAVKAGASMINDVRALREEGAIKAAAQTGAEVCLMHMQGRPRSMQVAPQYNNVVKEVSDFFSERVTACENAGIARELICIDPGFGFGKNLEDNCKLMKSLEQFSALELPLLIGVSRKSMIGQILEVETSERMLGSVCAAMVSLSKGARIVRVHDVKETVQARKIMQALN